MKNSKLLLILISVVFVSCQSLPQQPPETGYQPEFNTDLVGCWMLQSADSLFEGDLFITLGGTGVEYGAVGLEIQRREYDFLETEYSLETDYLHFNGRHYRRRMREPVYSPCDYFPDEGMIKLFSNSSGPPLCTRVNYDHDWNLFSEKWTVWSNDFGLENDTLLYDIEKYRIYCGSNNFFDWYSRLEDDWEYRHLFWAPFVPPDRWADEPYSESPAFRSVTNVNEDVAFTNSILSQMKLKYDEFYGIDYLHYQTYEEPTLNWLIYISYGWINEANFIKQLGVTSYTVDQIEWSWRRNRYEESEYYLEFKLGEGQIHLDLIDYINPLKTPEYERAKSDYRHLQRHIAD